MTAETHVKGDFEILTYGKECWLGKVSAWISVILYGLESAWISGIWFGKISVWSGTLEILALTVLESMLFYLSTVRNCLRTSVLLSSPPKFTNSGSLKWPSWSWISGLSEGILEIWYAVFNVLKWDVFCLGILGQVQRRGRGCQGCK